MARRHQPSPGQAEFDFMATAPADAAPVTALARAHLVAVAQCWALPVGQQVRLTLRGITHELSGRLLLATDPPRLDPHAPLHLRLHAAEFYHTEIESCTVMLTPPGGTKA